MTDWTKLEKDLINWLSSFSSEKLKFKNSHQAIVGFPSDGFRSDGMLTDNKVLIAFEIECGQTHPDTNTGKYWFLYSRHKKYKKIILFHVFTPKFNSYGYRKELSKFYIERMERFRVPIKYELLDYRKAKNYERTLNEIKQKARKIIKKEFKIC